MDYRTYTLSIKEYLYGSCLYISGISLLSYLFYCSFLPLIPLCPCVMFFYKYMRKFLKKKRDYQITIQFKDMLTSVSGLLATGFSLENAIIEAEKEIFSLYGASLMYRELDMMINKMKVNIPVEEVFADFANRTDIEAIHTFSQILSISKQTGGDLRSIIFSTTTNISSQIDIRMEIETHLAGKKYELYIMSAMPPIIMAYIKLTQPGFFNPVYHNVLGVIVMSFCLFVYVIAVIMAYKILSIKYYG